MMPELSRTAKNSRLPKKRKNSDELDDLITDALLGAVRGSRQRTADDNRTWANVLQRAQTEVIQLPPTEECALPMAEDGLIALTAENTQPVELMTQLSPETGLPYDFSAQMAHYRTQVQMKMWCSVGTLRLLGNSL